MPTLQEILEAKKKAQKETNLPPKVEMVASQPLGDMNEILDSGELDKLIPSDEEFAKIEKAYVETFGGEVNPNSMSLKPEDAEALASEVTGELDDLMKGQSMSESTLLADPEVKAQTIKEYDTIFKDFAANFAMTEDIYRQYGMVDENGNLIDPQDRVIPGNVGEVVKEVVKESVIKEENDTPETKEKVIKTTIRKKGVFDKESDAKLEKLRNRRKKGYCVTGFLPNSNLAIRTYPMNTSFKKQDLSESLMYSETTYFYNEKIAKMIYDHTSILASNGDKVVYESFLEMVHLDDLDDLLMLHIIAGTEGKGLSGWNVRCNSDDAEACNSAEFQITLDTKKVYEDSCVGSSEYLKAMKSYDKTKSVEQLVKESKVDEIHVLEYEDRGDVIRVNITRPSLKKYFNRATKIKEALITIMLKDEEVFNYVDNLKDWEIETVENKITILAYKFKQKYLNNIIKVQRFLYIDSIEIIPKYLIGDIELDISEHLDDIIVIDTEKDSVEIWSTFVYDMDDKSTEVMANKVMEVSDSIKRDFKYTVTCPTCGKVSKPIDFSPSELFSFWISSDSGQN